MNSSVNVKICSRCEGSSKYFCHFCLQELCQDCKHRHVIDLDTKSHNITLYRERFKYCKSHEKCPKHPDHIFEMYCELCNIPVCFHCRKHRNHMLLCIRTAYEAKRKQQNETIVNIRSEYIYKARVLLEGLRTDVIADINKCRSEFDHKQFEMERKSQRLKNIIKCMFGEKEDVISHEILYDRLLDVSEASMKANQTYDFSDISLMHKYCKHSCLLQRWRMIKYIAMILIYERRYEQSANRPVKFLRLIKTFRHPQIQATPNLTNHCPLSLSLELNIGDLCDFLSEIQIKEKGKRQLEKERLITLMSSPVLKKTFKVIGISNCVHMSLEAPDGVWASNHVGRINRTSITTGKTVYYIADSIGKFGTHTVNSKGELIYVDERNVIRKLSYNKKRKTIFIGIKDSKATPYCVYSSPTTGDLLVGMRGYAPYSGTAKVIRCSNAGKLKQIIKHDKKGRILFGEPCFITENNNGDIVVSDYWYRAAVIVTDSGGKHRFSYRGHLESEFQPSGVCTDSLSHILVCCANTDSVHIVDKDGQFLSYLQIKGLPEWHLPQSLMYDVNTHLLYVGMVESGEIHVFRHINRHFSLTGIAIFFYLTYI